MYDGDRFLLKYISININRFKKVLRANYDIVLTIINGWKHELKLYFISCDCPINILKNLCFNPKTLSRRNKHIDLNVNDYDLWSHFSRWAKILQNFERKCVSYMLQKKITILINVILLVTFLRRCDFFWKKKKRCILVDLL